MLRSAIKFLILAFIVSHWPCLVYEGLPLSRQTEALIFEMRHLLSKMLFATLQSTLKHIETLLYNSERQTWPVTCFSIIFILLGTESLQVDIYLRTENQQQFEEGCESMETNGIYVLVELFLIRTAGFSPLDLDWTMSENRSLLNRQEACIEAVQSLQFLSQSYCRSVHPRTGIAPNTL